MIFDEATVRADAMAITTISPHWQFDARQPDRLTMKGVARFDNRRPPGPVGAALIPVHIEAGCRYEIT